MADARKQPRVAVHYRLILRRAGIEGRGTTENLSERGAMLSVDIDPPLAAGETCEIDLELPSAGLVTVRATVRWASAVLPGMVGVEFGMGVPPELVAHLAQLEQDPAEAV